MFLNYSRIAIFGFRKRLGNYMMSLKGKLRKLDLFSESAIIFLGFYVSRLMSRWGFAAKQNPFFINLLE
jgi:hypothetical protein